VKRQAADARIAHLSAVYAASRLVSGPPRTRCSKVEIGAFGPTNGPTGEAEEGVTGASSATASRSDRELLAALSARVRSGQGRVRGAHGSYGPTHE
jgi:hypothetical protein